MKLSDPDLAAAVLKAKASVSNSASNAKEGSEIGRLARLPRLEYDRERKAAARHLGVRTSILDRLVAAERDKSDSDTKQGRTLSLPEPEPWPDPVDGARLLGDVSASIRRHVVMPEHAADATALWLLHTYLVTCAGISPRLAITSPEKGCGKTTLLDVLSHLVWRPLPTASATAAAIFRVVEMQQPTLLIDEADTFLPENEQLRGILNSGHRRGGFVLRTVGEDHEPRKFATYSACAIALIGKLPGTVADRSISIELRRRRADEPIYPFRGDRTKHLDELARKAARWASDHAEDVGAADPEMPARVINRAADNWRPLLAIAEVAGGEWLERARRAVAAMTQGTMEDQSAGVQVLSDIGDVFEARNTDRLTSADLVESLIAIEGRPWAEWRGGKPITPNGLARLLKPFGIAPTTIRVGSRTPKGYQLAQFADSFERYLSSEGASKPQHRNNTDDMGISEPFQTATPPDDVAARKHQKVAPNGVCCGVAAAAPPVAASAVAPDDGCDIPAFLRRSGIGISPDRRPVLGPLGDSLDDFK
jgi:putative DNA primase/helicase